MFTLGFNQYFLLSSTGHIFWFFVLNRALITSRIPNWLLFKCLQLLLSTLSHFALVGSCLAYVTWHISSLNGYFSVLVGINFNHFHNFSLQSKIKYTPSIGFIFRILASPWNKLPTDLDSSPTLNTFKLPVKSYVEMSFCLAFFQLHVKGKLTLCVGLLLIICLILLIATVPKHMSKLMNFLKD